MKKYLRTAIAAVLTLAAYNVNAQVETQNAHTILDATWTDVDTSFVQSDAQLFLNGTSTVHFTIKDQSPKRVKLENGSYVATDETGSDTYDNTNVSYLISVEVRKPANNTNGYEELGDAIYGFRRTSSGSYFYPITFGTYGYNNSSTYMKYTQSEVVNADTIAGTIDIENGSDDCYLYLELYTQSSSSDGTYSAYTGVTSSWWGGYTGQNEVDFGGSGSTTSGNMNRNVILSRLSTSTTRYDIYDDKPLWAQSSENTESSATADILSNRLNVKTHATTEISVYVHRKLVSGTWGTFCLPFDVKVSDMKSANALGSDAVIAEFDNVDLDNDVVNFKTISSSTTTLTAGKPYLIKYTGENKDAFYAPNVTFNYTTTAAQTSLNTLSNRKSTKTSHEYYYTGLLEPTQYNASSESIGSGYMVYISSNVESDGQHLKRLKSGGSIKGFRAYLYYPANAGAKATSGKGVIKIEDGLNDPTAITKVTVDGQQVSNLIYNLQGQCVGTDAAELKAGIYVRGGKKFVVK